MLTVGLQDTEFAGAFVEIIGKVNPNDHTITELTRSALARPLFL